MSRNFHYGFLMIAVAGLAALLIYRTSTPLAEPSVNVAEFGSVSLRLDYATTSETRERGLGGRAEISGNYGMLFVFPKDGYYGFWMKDMLIPIDIFWLDAQGQVISISQNVSPSSYPDVFYPTAPARYVLETGAGFAQANSIATGTPLSLKNFPSVTE